MPSTHSKPPLNLVFQGGGVKGVAFVGALETLYPRIKLTGCAGTSAGSIVASLLSAGYTPDELRDILTEESLSHILGINTLSTLKAPLTILRRGAFFDATPLAHWLDSKLRLKLELKEPCRFADLPLPLTVVVTDLQRQGALYFNTIDTPQSSVAWAVLYSCSIPYLFVAQQREGARLVDGGLVDNIALQHCISFYDNPAIAMVLEGKPLELRHADRLFKQLLAALTTRRGIAVPDANRHQVVSIETNPVATADFNISSKEQDYLIEQGRQGARLFLQRYGTLFGLQPIQEAPAPHQDTPQDKLIVRIRRKRRIRGGMRTFLAILAILVSLWVLSQFLLHGHEQYYVTTFAGTGNPGTQIRGTPGSSQFNSPSGIAFGPGGRILVADTYNGSIRVIGPTGAQWVIHDDDTPLNNPFSLAVDTAGDVFVADLYNNVIRRFRVDWGSQKLHTLETVFAGQIDSPGDRDGKINESEFLAPMGLALLEYNDEKILFVADSGNSIIRWIDINRQQVSTLSFGHVSLDYPQDVKCVQRDGQIILYIADTFKHRIIKTELEMIYSSSGKLDIRHKDAIELAVDGFVYGDRGGALAMARRQFRRPYRVKFLLPYQIAVDHVGNVYVADYGNGIVWMIADPFDAHIGQSATRVAGGPSILGHGGYVDGWGSRARFSRPSGLAVDPNGRIFVADDFNHSIRLITPQTWTGRLWPLGASESVYP